MSGRKNSSLDDILIDAIESNLTNRDLYQLTILEFGHKGFNTNIIQEVFSGEVKVNTLLDNYKIALLNSFHKHFGIDKFKASNYFSEDKMFDYEGITPEVNVVDEIVLKNFRMKNENELFGDMTYKQVYDYLTNSKLYYNLDTQREPKLKKIGSEYINVPNIDTNAVDSIKEAILNNQFEDTQIVLNCRLSNSGVKLKFDETYKSNDIVLGNVIIDQKLDVVDGMHRILAIANAQSEYYSKFKKYKEDTISVRLVIRDVQSARNIVLQSFKRSDTGRDYLNAIEENDYTKFVNLLEKKCLYLENNIGKTYEESVAFKKLSYMELVVKMLKRLEIQVNDRREVSEYVKIFSERLTEIYIEIDRFIEKNSNSNVKILKNVNMFAVYMQLAFNLKDEDLVDFRVYDDLINKIDNLSDENIKSLKVQTKACNIDKLIEYFV